ncbi:MAG: tetratricopeptide repeat protein [Ignavibacteriales bacterium]|nr:tetratricopeptide repeat protein [Ignavibacteriales bacterium]
MKRTIIFSILSALLMLSLSAFQCSSTELTSAKLYIQQKNYAKAIEALKKEVEKNPKSDEGFYFLGYLHGEQGNYKDMMDAFDKSLAISKKFEKNIVDSKKAYWANSFNRGVAFFNKSAKATQEDSVKGYMDKAISSFNDAIMIEPDSADTYKNLSFALLQTGKADEAVQPLEKLIKLKKTPDSYRILGQLYIQKGLTDQGIYKQSKKAEDSLAAVANYNKAIVVLEEGRKHFPEDSDILFFLSNAYVSANKAEVAMDVFKAGVEKDPTNQYYRYNFGTLLLQANKFEMAAEQFQKAIDIDPKYHSAYYNLAVTYVRWGTALREKADVAGVEDPERKNKYKQALPLLQKALEIKPDDAISWETIAKVYAVLGMNKESQDAFSKADQFRK